MGMHFGRDEDGQLQAPADARARSRARDVSGGRRARIRLEAAPRARARRRAADRPAVRHRADARRRRPHHRRGRHQQPHRRVQRHQGARHHRRDQRHHVPLRLRARHHRHRHAARLSRPARRLRNAEFSYVRPGTPKFYFEGITFAIQEGARWVNAKGEAFMRRATSRNGATRPTCRASPSAMAMENQQGQHAALSRHVADPRAPARLFHPEQGEVDGLFLPQARRRGQDRHVRQDAVLRAQPDDQDGHPHRRRTAAPTCRGCSSAGLAQAGCANHFAGFHIGLCVGNGWIAGRSRDRGPRPAAGAARSTRAEVRALHAETQRAARTRRRSAESDRILRDLQAVMFAYDIGILKREDRLQAALDRVERARGRVQDYRRAAHPRAGAAQGDRGDAARGALHPRRLALSAPSRGSATSARIHDRATTTNWLVWVDIEPTDGKARVQQDADPDAALPGHVGRGAPDAACDRKCVGWVRRGRGLASPHGVRKRRAHAVESSDSVGIALEGQRKDGGRAGAMPPYNKFAVFSFGDATARRARSARRRSRTGRTRRRRSRRSCRS